MANTKQRLTIIDKVAEPIPWTRVLLLGGACAILLGLAVLFHFVFIARVARLDVPGIKLGEVFVAFGVLLVAGGLFGKVLKTKAWSFRRRA